jgi:hypothetical protein
MRPVIKRHDWSFDHEGHRYSLTQGGWRWGYAIHNESGVVVADNLFTLNEVRDFVEQGLLYLGCERPEDGENSG